MTKNQWLALKLNDRVIVSNTIIGGGRVVKICRDDKLIWIENDSGNRYWYQSSDSVRMERVEE